MVKVVNVVQEVLVAKVVSLDGICFSPGACTSILFCCDQLQNFLFGPELLTFVSNDYLQVVIYFV